ncbi:hypothetical protein D3OALGA1CA_4070 [Olavius algarvensis associated proteobacterium Delta 3]|nr:hypothetical protein D3OALGB2SA_983 [Olavius algarvensis associated proteobacterium Delta 3]CAB5144742.1 hypothetical protein D3OALGA1CA_4070 [Olavius algarvensis associated proteobacterium Delta 3]
MKESKRKQIENQLRRLMESDERNRREFEARPLEAPRSIRVIRRRKGRPDQHIFNTSNRPEPAEMEIA